MGLWSSLLGLSDDWVHFVPGSISFEIGDKSSPYPAIRLSVIVEKHEEFIVFSVQFIQRQFSASSIKKVDKS